MNICRKSSSNSEHYAKELAYTCEKLKSSQSALKGSKSEVYNLKQKCARAIAVKENAVQKASSDGTGHKNLNYNSHYAHYKVRDADGEQAQRSLDGSSEQAMRDWDDQLQKIFDIYNDSPLAKEQSSFTHLINVYSKLAGMHADHCAKEKKDYDLMGKKKTEAVHQVLGKRRIIDDTNDKLMPLFLSAHKEMVEKAGGEADWNNLDESAQKEHKAAMLEKLTTDLGQDAFEKLSDKEKAIFKLFVWVGCGCHKDLNTVLGGYIALRKFWVEHRLEPPVLLPNKFNEDIIQEAAKEDKNDSEAAQRAVKNSSQGGIKATKLAGDILNNKNDKSGHHDQFRTWWKTKVGKKFTFPDTSNTHFQSHCEAAAALTLHLDKFVEYLKYAKDKKERARYSHMEENLWKALHDIPTRTELAVLALYSQAVSHHYMRAIQKDASLNALNLGPLHKKIESFLVQIIEDPTFLVGKHVSHTVGTFDGTPWHSQEVIDKINKLAPDFPHLKPALHFTSEFAPGGLIDEVTQEERDLAWMPSTNDINEGALGSFRVLMQHQPQLTLLQYNAQTMFFQNNTGAFMNEIFSDTTHQYIRAVSRERDTSEKERLEQIVQHTEEKIAKKVAAKTKCTEHAVQVADHISKVALIFKEDEIDKLKGEKLKDHLQAFKKAGAPNLGTINSKSKVAEKREAIKAAIRSYNKGEWKLSPKYVDPGIQNEDEGEVFDGYNDFHSSDENSGWEGE
ncbi:hypothetical protein BYT27DRAFT_7232639 [Phlegmacium glaucopus]|nr:hypothetical protein BYT27DRAFT_7232639 [Phlegmacium glaucopus]